MPVAHVLPDSRRRRNALRMDEPHHSLFRQVFAVLVVFVDPNYEATGYAYVIASDLPYLACGQRFWSLEEDNGPAIVQLKLNPGTYWFSTDAYVGKLKKKPHMRKVKADLLANHEYSVQLDKNHELVVNELNDRTRSGHFFSYDTLH